MINTGLPYSTENMEEIYSDGAIVDMSNIDFPGIPPEKNPRTSIIYLRNTNYKTELDFSNCSYEFKRDILKEYFLGDIYYKIPELDITILSLLLFKYKNQEIPSIFTEEERNKFIEGEESFLKNIYLFIDSIPLYIYSRLMNQEGRPAFDIKNYSNTDSIPCNKNIINTFDYPQFIDILIEGNNPVFFNKIFTIEETELFEACKDLTFFHMIETLLEFSAGEATDFLQKVDETYEHIQEK